MEQKIAFTMNTQKVKNRDLWLGIAHVEPMVSGLIPEESRAHVTVFGYANNIEEFRASAYKLLNAIQFEVLALDEVENLPANEFQKRVENSIWETVVQLNEDGPVGYGSFYTYKEI